MFIGGRGAILDDVVKLVKEAGRDGTSIVVNDARVANEFFSATLVVGKSPSGGTDVDVNGVVRLEELFTRGMVVQ